MITYRKTKSGEWVVYGPASELIASTGQHYGCVSARTKDGTPKTAYLRGVGKVFEVDGVEMVYGYLDQARSRGASAGRERAQARRDGDPTWWE